MSPRFDLDQIRLAVGTDILPAAARLSTHIKARRPGKWLVHCHFPDHTTNNNVEHRGGGGLTMILEVAE